MHRWYLDHALDANDGSGDSRSRVCSEFYGSDQQQREITVYETKINELYAGISRLDCSVALEWNFGGGWERMGASPNVARWGTWSYASSGRWADEVSGYGGDAVFDWNAWSVREWK
jgi:hypothetical protein